MPYQNLLDFEEKGNKSFSTVVTTTKKPKKKPEKEWGCETCPLNKGHLTKVINIDKLEGRKIAVLAQAPGREENKKGIELIGPAGQLLWRAAKSFGITRGDCDIQNVVRCRPTKVNEYGYTIDRAPNREEINHCAYWTAKAIPRMSPKVFLILGEVAARAFLGREYRKDRKVFWSEKFQTKVICTYHPSYFLRGAPRSKLKEFYSALRAVAEVLRGKSSRFAFIESQDYKSVETFEDISALFNGELSQANHRIAVDGEWGSVNDRPAFLCAGFCHEAGHSRVVYVDHPETKLKRRSEVIQLLANFMEDPKARKIMHYGNSDSEAFQKMLGIKVQGYTYDTLYAEYLTYSNRRSYALAEIAQVRFPEFAGYKEIVADFRDNLARTPRKLLTPYNGADCDLTKRIELSTKDRVNLALLRIYVYVAFVIQRMQTHGPKLDFKHADYVESVLPKRVKALDEKLKLLAGNPEFNPRSPKQVANVMYNVLKIPKVLVRGEEDDGTALGLLEILAQEHDFPKLEIEFRKDVKMEDYLKGFKKSANAHGGEVRTIWWLTGTSTGRLRSGSGGNKNENVVNLQNTHGDPLIENLLISDVRWRDIL